MQKFKKGDFAWYKQSFTLKFIHRITVLEWLKSNILHTQPATNTQQEGGDLADDRTPQNTGERESVKEQRKNRWSETRTGCLHYIQPSLPPGKRACCVLYSGDKTSLARSKHMISWSKNREMRWRVLATFSNMCLTVFVQDYMGFGEDCAGHSDMSFPGRAKMMTACL